VLSHPVVLRSVGKKSATVNEDPWLTTDLSIVRPIDSGVLQSVRYELAVTEFVCDAWSAQETVAETFFWLPLIVAMFRDLEYIEDVSEVPDRDHSFVEDDKP